MEHPQGARGVAARPSEYETATMAWLERTVQFLMLARDPLYAQLRSEQVDGLTATTISLGRGQEFLVEPTRITVTGEVPVCVLLGMPRPTGGVRVPGQIEPAGGHWDDGSDRLGDACLGIRLGRHTQLFEFQRWHVSRTARRILPSWRWGWSACPICGTG